MGWAWGDWVGDAQVERAVTVGDVDSGVAGSVPGGVGQGLLQDPVRRLIQCRAERSRDSRRGANNREPGGGVLCDERVERGEPGRGLDAGAGVGIAQRAHEVVDVVGGSPCQDLDRLQGPERAIRVVLVAQAGRAAHRDHVDGMACGVVQVTGDPASLFGGGQQAIALRFAFELGDLLAA
jgi:hypothetical protein